MPPPGQFEKVLAFDHDGPRLGHLCLLRKTSLGFVPLPADQLRTILSSLTDQAIDTERLRQGLESVARHMNTGAIASAALASGYLPAPDLSDEQYEATREIEALLKASTDDPVHPGYPKGDPSGKGGQFRPKNETPIGAEPTSSSPIGRAERLQKLAQRRALRSVLTRVLSTKRLLRLLGENIGTALVEEVPGVDAVATGATLADDLAALDDIATEIKGADVAIAFVEKGPADLEDLMVGTEGQSFDSFDAFKKLEIEKFFGDAGTGFDYHHIVEQGRNAGIIPDTSLQSADNIVKIPRLLHEEINSFYNTPQDFGGHLLTPRDFLKGKSFEEQKDFGLNTLHRLGILK